VNRRQFLKPSGLAAGSLLATRFGLDADCPGRPIVGGQRSGIKADG